MTENQSKARRNFDDVRVILDCTEIFVLNTYIFIQITDSIVSSLISLEMPVAGQGHNVFHSYSSS